MSIAIVCGLATLSGELKYIITLGFVGLLIYGLCRVGCAMLTNDRPIGTAQIKEVPAVEVPREGRDYPLSLYNIPEEFRKLLQQIRIELKTEMHREGAINFEEPKVVTKFMVKLHARNMENYPTPPVEAIVAKIIWEYRRKHGTMTYSNRNYRTVTKDDVLRPLETREQPEFLTFYQELVTPQR